ncbi:MAG: carboxypeptidase-like regulatory domain-containing protein, partial [Planctomycetota bacterium]
MAQNWIISGTVLDAAGGAISGVDLDLVDPANSNVEIPISGDNTDVNGVFSLTVLTTLVPETYILQINPPPGFLSTELEIDLDGNFDVGTINIGSGWIITGLVEDTLGNPISPIDIDIRGNAGWLDLTDDFTEPDGSFSITIPALVDEYRFVYRMTSPQPTAFPLQIDNVFLFQNTALGTIVMESAHTLTGTVVDEAGAPLVGIDMNIYDAQGNSTDLNNDDTNAAGNFSVLVPRGTWDVVHRQVNASASGERISHAFLELNVLENLDLGTLTMPLGYHVTGLLVGSSGEVIVGANLDAEITETEIPIHLNNDSSNAAGEFDILLPAGNLNVEIDPPVAGPVRRPQLLPISVAAPGPLDLGTIVLPDAVLLSGRCIDTGGTPIPLIDVELLVSSTGEPYPTLHENGAPDGTFAVAIEIGTYHLLLLPSSSSGLAPVEIPQLEILSDTNLGDLVLNPGVSLSGTVL